MTSGLAVALVAALVAVLLTRHGSGTPAADRRAPFAAALVDLALRPGVRYRAPAGDAGWSESRVTAGGEALGEMPYAGTRVTALTVDGTTYLKMPDTPGAGLGDPGGGTDLAGKWVAGVPSADTAGGAAPRAGMSPTALANALLDAVDSEGTTLSDAAATAPLPKGVPALRASTARGDLYVTKARPYRVLAFVPRGAAADGHGRADPAAWRAGTREPAAGDRLAAFAAGASAPAGAFAVSALSTAEAKALLGEVQEDTAQLSGALDAGVTARLEEKPQVSCSAAGCEVSSHITGIVPGREARKRITGGRVTVELTATLTIEGRPAGSCTATEEMPPAGAGDIACSDPDAGPVFAEQEDEKRREAESGSASQGGTPVPYDVRSVADVTVRVLAEVDVSALRQAQQQEQAVLEAPAPATVLERAAPSGGDGADDCARTHPAGADPNGAGWILNTHGANGRAETGQACLRKPPNNSSDETKADPVGYPEARAKVRALGRDPRDDLARCRIVAARFGGSNTRADNLSPCGQRITNNGPLGMSAFESEVAGELAREPSGSVRYLVQPFFASPRSVVPEGFVMIAIGYTPAGIPAHVLSRSVLNVVEPAGGGSLVNLGK
ncbi:DNA/RNA non-specific endonuclease [Streptomyces misionensis]|uniref:DNA/RNA non-specific endonuclease n=1 Tax=Streptomyces misionensis TaxID=67331 RepID=UPI0037FD4A09